MAKTQDKHLNIFRTKRAFKMKWKAFFIIFKGLSLSEIKQFCFGTWESDFNRDQCQFMEMTLLQKRPSKSSNMIRLKKTILRGKNYCFLKASSTPKKCSCTQLSPSDGIKFPWFPKISYRLEQILATTSNFLTISKCAQKRIIT